MPKRPLIDSYHTLQKNETKSYVVVKVAQTWTKYCMNGQNGEEMHEDSSRNPRGSVGTTATTYQYYTLHLRQLTGN